MEIYRNMKHLKLFEDYTDLNKPLTKEQIGKIKYFYHATPESNFVGIMREGIKPSYLDKAVYLTDTPEDAAKFMALNTSNDLVYVFQISASKLDKKKLKESADHNISFFECRAYTYNGIIQPDAFIKNKILKFQDLKENINEYKSVGPLYHYTTTKGLEAILKQDKMISKQYDFISFTRNPALKFYDRNIRIVFNGDAMSNKFHIEPYLYDEDKDPLFQSGFGDEPGEPRMTYAERRKLYGDEREERSKAPLDGIKKYIARIDVRKRVLKNGEIDKDFMRIINKLQLDYPEIDFNISDKFELPIESKKKMSLKINKRGKTMARIGKSEEETFDEEEDFEEDFMEELDEEI